MSLGSKLKQARNKSKLTLAATAEKLQINISTLTRYENDSVLPPLDKLETLAKLYNVPLTYLVTDSEGSTDSVKQWISNLSPTELQALQEFIQKQLQDNQ